MKTILVILVALFAVCAYGQASYEGYRLLRLIPETQEQVKLLADLENSVDVSKLFSFRVKYFCSSI